MKKIIVGVIIAITLFSCTKQASNQLATEETKRGRGHNQQVEALATMTLTNNGGGSFSIDYGGATDIVWVFFRGGDSLSVSGNVIPAWGQSFYLNPVTTFTAWGTGIYYQAVIATGNVNDAAGWIFTYTNVVQ